MYCKATLSVFPGLSCYTEDMNILSLNCWGGRLKEALTAFISSRQDIDVFCLQEVFSADDPRSAQGYRPDYDFKLYNDIAALLPGHTGYFGENETDSLWELAIFVRKGIAIESSGSLPICRLPDDHPRHLQYVTIRTDTTLLTVAHLHGAWIRGSKLDTPERLRQSETILGFLKNLQGDIALLGDFNLMPHTESIHLLEVRFRNLISEYNIRTTRNKYCTKTADLFADYAFVSEGIDVDNFSVLSDEVSDHAPLLLSINL